MFSMRRVHHFVPLLLLAGFVLSACGAQSTKVGDREADFVLALPQIVIDIDPEGVPSIAGVSPDTVKAITFGQVDISLMRVPKDTVDWFTRANIQHFELVHKDDGLFLYANAKPLPHIGWSGESFATVGELASQLGLLNEQFAGMVKMALPFLQRVGMDVVFKFPLQKDATAVPLADTTTTVRPATSAAGDAEAAVMARVNVKYSDDGVPSVLNLSSRDLARAIGYDLSMAELPPATLQWVKDRGIQHVAMRSTAGGVLIWVNGKPLPALVWSDEYLKNGVDLYSQLFYVDENLRASINTFLPALSKIDAEFVLRFPLAPGAQAIPVPNQ